MDVLDDVAACGPDRHVTSGSVLFPLDDGHVLRRVRAIPERIMGQRGGHGFWDEHRSKYQTGAAKRSVSQDQGDEMVQRILKIFWPWLLVIWLQHQHHQANTLIGFRRLQGLQGRVPHVTKSILWSMDVFSGQFP